VEGPRKIIEACSLMAGRKMNSELSVNHGAKHILCWFW